MLLNVKTLKLKLWKIKDVFQNLKNNFNIEFQNSGKMQRILDLSTSYEMHTKVWTFGGPLLDFSMTDKSIICY